MLSFLERVVLWRESRLCPKWERVSGVCSFWFGGERLLCERHCCLGSFPLSVSSSAVPPTYPELPRANTLSLSLSPSPSLSLFSSLSHLDQVLCVCTRSSLCLY